MDTEDNKRRPLSYSSSIVNTALSIMAVVISITSVGVAWMQTHAAQKQVQAAEQQNQELRYQFINTGPVVTVSSRLEAKFSYNDWQAPPVTAELVNEGAPVYFVVDIANSGRSDTTIQSVRLNLVYDSVYAEFAPPSASFPDYIIYCRELGVIEPKNCASGSLPHGVDAGKSLQVIFPITLSLHEQIAPGPLMVEIRAVGISQQPLQYVSKIKTWK